MHNAQYDECIKHRGPKSSYRFSMHIHTHTCFTYANERQRTFNKRFLFTVQFIFLEILQYKQYLKFIINPSNKKKINDNLLYLVNTDGIMLVKEMSFFLFYFST